MSTSLEFEELKSAWQALDARLARQHGLQLELLREQRSDEARRNLRPLHAGVFVQMLLGIGLVLLGVGCWSRNPEVPALLASGIALHAFGVLNIAFAGMVLGLSSTVDYAAPVLALQKRLQLLLRLQVLNSNLCGAPWWVMWVVVVVGFAGLSPDRASGGSSTWIWISLGIGIVGLLATWLWAAFGSRGPRDPLSRVDDGTGGIRRNLRLLDELDRFERE